VIRDGIDGLTDVVVFNSHVQPTAANLVGFNPCQEDNGRCQQLCFALPEQEKPTCACAHGSLLNNGVSCGYGLDEFLLFTTDYTMNSLRLDPSDHTSPYPTINLGYNVMALDFDFADKRIFFTQYMGIGRSRIGYVITTVTGAPVIIADSKCCESEGWGRQCIVWFSSFCNDCENYEIVKIMIMRFLWKSEKNA
jgi:low density lipoprotein-related protein 2